MRCYESSAISLVVLNIQDHLWFRSMGASKVEKNVSSSSLQDDKDNFSKGLVSKRADDGVEHRLHMLSFDYWLSLKGDKLYPLFSDLRAEDLALFKANSLLLEFTKAGIIVRYVGGVIMQLIDGPVTIGSYLTEFPDCSFSQALIDQFGEEDGRDKAAEFEFVEENIECRGVMLPFSSDGDEPHFIMVTASFIRREPAVGLEAKVSVDTENFDQLINEYHEAAQGIVHKDQTIRMELYKALDHALELYEQSHNDVESFKAVLQEAGLKQQARAPYTPALKLVFGKDYDKTRLTEYAAALSCAVRQGVGSGALVSFLLNFPGGIKGCVQKERNYKREKSGTAAHNRQQKAVKALLKTKAVPLKKIQSDDEFCLVLARRKDGGGVDLLGEVETSQATLDAAVRHMAFSNKK